MKYALTLPLFAVFFAASSFSQEPIYRCGNEYTNTKPTSEKSGCRLLEGSNVTVIQGTRSNAGANAPVRVAAATQSSTPRIDSGDQKSRDSDARQILESELKKAETRQAELVREYNNGEPEKQGGEARNHQKYLDRVAELKASLSRNESDIAGIRRELGRLPASK
ncbi:MAG: hypothetical protein RL211_2100 [Pseudomonadota bacterium]|jgi:hypothetical protein